MYFRDNVLSIFGHICRIAILTGPEKMDCKKTERNPAVQMPRTKTSSKILTEVKETFQPIVMTANDRRVMRSIHMRRQSPGNLTADRFSRESIHPCQNRTG